MYDTSLILIFYKNVLCHTRGTGAVVQFLLNVLLIVVMNCFLGILDSVNCTAFRNMMYHLRLPLFF